MLLQVNNIFQRLLSTFYSTSPSAPQSTRYTTSLAPPTAQFWMLISGWHP
jgi:hypothetical protein